MNNTTSAIMVLVIIALLAIIAKLLGRKILAIAGVALLGMLAINTPGHIGDITDSIAGWVLGVPAMITGWFS